MIQYWSLPPFQMRAQRTLCRAMAACVKRVRETACDGTDPIRGDTTDDCTFMNTLSAPGIVGRFTGTAGAAAARAKAQAFCRMAVWPQRVATTWSPRARR
jgi:hypothetical protein